MRLHSIRIGPITLTVADGALLLSVLAGPDPRDATSVDRPVEDYPAALTGRRMICASACRDGSWRTLTPGSTAK